MPIRRRVPGLRTIHGIAEVFEDLAAEVTVEILVYEDFLDLNPQVREFPNLSPNDSTPVLRDEVRDVQE